MRELSLELFILVLPSNLSVPCYGDKKQKRKNMAVEKTSWY